ncbi:MAG: hypothetical protein FH748_16000 [Balneolaceae bacterium]|nr:hypothetical protein [Balneolaceae bacterium]
MDPVELKSGDYTGTYKLIGGDEVSLDLVNTIAWPDTEKEHDWLDSTDNFLSWAVASGVINTGQEKDLANQPGTKLEKELVRVHEIRSGLADVLRPLAHDEQPASSALNTLNDFMREAVQYRYLSPDYQWKWDIPETLPQVLNSVIWNAVHVLTDLDHTRIGHCPSCDWIFYDTTRNRSRKWCDMEDCGSRDKALRYYHRTKKS